MRLNTPTNRPAISSSFKKVVLWGHKLHSHTHSYIHYGFFRAFEHLGYDVYWLDRHDDIMDLDLTDALFISEGQVIDGIPRLNNAIYVLHNCDQERYPDIFSFGAWINIQVYTDDVKRKPTTQIDEYLFVNKGSRTLYMPWATDLLPNEIDQLDETHPIHAIEPQACFVGTIGEGEFGNLAELLPFASTCESLGIRFIHRQNVDPGDAMVLVRNSLLAPAIQGRWQVEHGYIPCRIFKNISYGQIGITNSTTVNQLFGGSIVYNKNTQRLADDALAYIQSDCAAQIAANKRFVRDNHTYLNRCAAIVTALDMLIS